MKTEFDVNISEKNMFVFLFNNTYRRMTGIIWIIFSIVIIGVTVYTWGDVKIQNSILIILLASLYTVINPLMLYSRARKQVRNNDYFANVLHYVVDEEGVKVSQNGQNASVKWDEVWKIVRYGSEIAAYVSTDRAFIWPMESIKDNYNDIVQMAEEHIGKRCHIRKSA